METVELSASDGAAATTINSNGDILLANSMRSIIETVYNKYQSQTTLEYVLLQ